MFNRRFARRAALRAAMSGAAAAAIASLAGERGRNGRAAAIATAAAVGAATESTVAGVAIASAGTVTLAARHRSTPIEALAGGAAIALATRRLWPVAPKNPAEIRPHLTTNDDPAPAPDGTGLAIVVNPAAGPALRKNPADTLRDALPGADLLELDDDRLDFAAALKRAATSANATTIGIAGGDGSISAAAAAAHAAGKRLLVIPTGTLNHLARDLGVGGIDDAVDAVQNGGQTVVVDVGNIDGKTFLNTASFGAYTELVDARERLEATLGKWPALLVALVQVLRRSTPVRVELDGRERLLWMTFIGNCHYRPNGFAPSWRERLDDGQLDIRLVDASQPFARVRLLLAVLTGRLGRCRVYETFTTRSLHVRSLDGPLRLARDGETFDGSAEFDIRKEDRPLAVYVPLPESDPSQRPTTTSSTANAATPAAVSHGPASLYAAPNT